MTDLTGFNCVVKEYPLRLKKT